MISTNSAHLTATIERNQMREAAQQEPQVSTKSDKKAAMPAYLAKASYLASRISTKVSSLWILGSKFAQPSGPTFPSTVQNMDFIYVPQYQGKFYRKPNGIVPQIFIEGVSNKKYAPIAGEEGSSLNTHLHTSFGTFDASQLPPVQNLKENTFLVSDNGSTLTYKGGILTLCGKEDVSKGLTKGPNGSVIVEVSMKATPDLSLVYNMTVKAHWQKGGLAGLFGKSCVLDASSNSIATNLVATDEELSSVDTFVVYR